MPIGFLLGPSGLNLLPGTRSSTSIPSSRSASPRSACSSASRWAGGLHWDTRLFAAASMEAIVTVLVVLAAILTLLRAWQMPMTVPTIAIALALGVAASASSAPAAASLGSAHALASRIADLDDVILIAVGALAIALITHDGF